MPVVREVAFRRSVLAILFVALATVVSAQRYRLPEGPNVPPRFPPAAFADGAFAFCKVMYTSVRRESMGVGWSTDYPYAGIHLMIRLSELTRTRISRTGDGEPNHWVVRLTDDALFQCPFTMASDVGTIGLSEDEVARLRAYLLKGGFLWVDDFWGTPAWQHWSAEIARVLPDYAIADVPDDHPIRRTVFHLSAIPQITNINFWRRTGMTAERGADSPHSNFRMIADERNRIMVLMTHNTDIADAWEREGEDSEFFRLFSPEGYALGINALVYAMTH
jgi:hypothetical protein